MKLTRKQIRENLDTVPIDSILGRHVSRELTPKQKRFAREVAQGATKAEAYRKAYKPNPAPATISAEPYRVAANPRVNAEIQAYQAAIEAAKYRTPAALRELVIQSLVSVVINPETKDSVKVSAAKVLGTVTEVAAFTERKEIKTISSSEDAKAKIMVELKRLIKDSAEDIEIVDLQATALLAELAGKNDGAGAENEGGAADTHPVPTPPNAASESQTFMHTIPHEVPPPNLDSPDTMQDDDLENPPHAF